MTADALTEAVARALVAANFVATKQTPKPGEIDHYWKSYIPEARAALAAIEANGFRVVPVEPTEEMIEAALMNEHDAPDNCWDAMLSAAPKLTEGGS